MDKNNMDPVTVVEGEVREVVALEHELANLETALMDNPQFQQLITLRKTFNEKYAEARKKIGEVMIPAYTAGKIDKSLKGEWGSITVTETDEFDINKAELPSSFWVKVPDTKKIRIKYQLEDKLPKGVSQSKKYGLRIDIKSLKEDK